MRNEPTGDSRLRIEEEHAALRRLLDRLDSRPSLDHLIPLLSELRALLVEHFASEEADDGLHAAIGSTAPRFSHSLDELFAEHRELLQVLDGLTDGARECIEAVKGLNDRVHALCHRLHEHEARETALFSDAIYAELGAGD